MADLAVDQTGHGDDSYGRLLTMIPFGLGRGAIAA